MMGRIGSIALTMAIALSSTSALASPLFPNTVATTLSVNPPACTLCHTTIEGEKGTATQPFARRLIGKGLIAGDTRTLGDILRQMKESGTDDSDGDGVGDIAELEQNRDPNINDVTGKPPDEYPPPSYGCSIASMHGVACDAAALDGALAACLVAAAVMRRRRRLAR